MNDTQPTTVADPTALLQLAEKILGGAEPGEEVEVAVSAGSSTSVRVYGGEVESFTSAETSAVGIRVIVEGREGFASAGTLDPDVVAGALRDARDNAVFAERDEFSGVAQADDVQPVDIDLWRDSVASVSPAEKIQIAVDLERRVKAGDPRITGVRVSSFGDSAGAFALASTSGIRASTRATSASASVQALATDGDRSQTGAGWDAAREPSALDLDWIVERAISRSVDLIGSTKPETGTVDLVLEPQLAATVLGLTSGTLTGDRINKGRSPFADRLGEEIASPLLTMFDDPTDPESLGADSHDGEGLACRRNELLVDGVLKGFLYDAYNARKGGVQSTGSAVRSTRGLPSPGVHALSVANGSGGSLDQLIASVDLGVYVFGLAGLHSGVNAVSGDFSVGVEGRMIRNGELAEPIGECTIGSTLQRLLLSITSVGSDRVHLPSGVSTPSLLVSGVRLSGS